MYTGPPKSSLVGVVLNFTKFTKNYTKTFTFYTSIIPLPGKTKHLKTPGIQNFISEQGTLGPGALYKLRYIFKICYYNYVIFVLLDFVILNYTSI